MNIQILCPDGHPVVIHVGKLGGTAFCPHCLAAFVAERSLDAARHARPEKGKARPARDDDDDEDEEEEKPLKKMKAVPPKKKKGDEAEEEERPKVKRPVRKKRDEEEEDEDEDTDEEDEEEEEQEEEIPIEWTPRKRQLSVVRNGVMAFLVGFWAMVGYYLLFAVITVMNLMLQFGVNLAEFLIFILCGILGGIAIAYIALLVGWIMSLWGPTKAELRSNAILAIVFLAMPALLLIISSILTASDFFRNDAVQTSFATLIGGGCAICLFISLLFGLALLGKLCLFMGDKKLSSQPITLGFGVIGFTVLNGGLIQAHGYLYRSFLEAKNDLYNYLAYAMVAASLACLFFLLRSLHGLVGVCQKLRVYIDKYIRDE